MAVVKHKLSIFSALIGITALALVAFAGGPIAVLIVSSYWDYYSFPAHERERINSEFSIYRQQFDHAVNMPQNTNETLLSFYREWKDSYGEVTVPDPHDKDLLSFNIPPQKPEWNQSLNRLRKLLEQNQILSFPHDDLMELLSTELDIDEISRIDYRRLRDEGIDEEFTDLSQNVFNSLSVEMIKKIDKNENHEALQHLEILLQLRNSEFDCPSFLWVMAACRKQQMLEKNLFYFLPRFHPDMLFEIQQVLDWYERDPVAALINAMKVESGRMDLINETFSKRVQIERPLLTIFYNPYGYRERQIFKRYWVETIDAYERQVKKQEELPIITESTFPIHPIMIIIPNHFELMKQALNARQSNNVFMKTIETQIATKK